MRIAVFLPNWIGDVVMATPTLRALRQHFGEDAEIVGVMRPYVADVLAGTPWLDRWLFYDPRSRDREVRSRILVRKLRQRQPDMAFLFPHSFRTGLLAWLSGATRVVGYAEYGRGFLLTDRLKIAKSNGRFKPSPTVDLYLRLAEYLGADASASQVELATLPADEQRADEVWQQLGLPEGQEVVLLNTGAAYGAAKNWPEEHFAELARRIAEQMDLHVLVLCGPAERNVAARIAVAANHPRVQSLSGQELSIGLSKACVRRSRLMVSTDSGPRHFAAAFDVPVITLYGPTHIAWGDTRHPQAVNLQLEMPCGPCMKRDCPLRHHLCMRDLTVNRVYGAVVRQLEHTAIAAA